MGARTVGKLLSLIVVASIVFFVWSHRGSQRTEVVYVTVPATAAPATAVAQRATIAPALTATPVPTSRPTVQPTATLVPTATTRPTAIPTATPQPTPTAAILSQRGTSTGFVDLPQFSVVTNFDDANGLNLYDHRVDAGWVLILDQAATVGTRSGGEIYQMRDAEGAFQQAQKLAATLHTTGCKDNKGCAVVNIIHYPSLTTIPR